MSDIDKREKEITLTNKSKDYLPIWIDLINKMESDALRDISMEEFEIFNKVLDKLISNQRA